ncbi:MAG: zinc-binding dehydrogenase [Verrucomicrobia bacterium]|nr:zinc-binding dehydrogenase [Verrucomicrobiota bacterium]
MKAFQLVTHGAPGKFEFRDIADPKPAANEVVIRVRACGLNRLDLWAEEAGLPVTMELPRTLGGEISGEVIALGEKVKEWHKGDRVAVQSNVFCGTCEFCVCGEESICLNGKLLGVHRDGGFAEQVVVPAHLLVCLPENVSFENSAALTLAGSTAMHMLTKRTQVEMGDWVLVIGGASGVGSAAIQIAKQLGAYVISTGSSDAKRDFAKQLGADCVIDSNDSDWPGEVRKITEKRGVDIVVEHVGGEVLMKCFECLARNGTVVTCGATAGRNVQINLWPFFVKQHSLVGSYGRNQADIVNTLDWLSEGRIKAPLHQVFPLDQAAEAFKLLRNRAVLGKLVVTP